MLVHPRPARIAFFLLSIVLAPTPLTANPSSLLPRDVSPFVDDETDQKEDTPPYPEGRKAQPSCQGPTGRYHPRISIDRGSTRLGSAIMTLFSYPLGLLHADLCKGSLCYRAELSAKDAYINVFLEYPQNEEQRVADLFTSEGRYGGKCFLFCNRFSTKNVAHLDFVRSYFSNFSSPYSNNPVNDYRALMLLAACLSMRPERIPLSKTFLGLLMESNPSSETFCQGNQRCVVVMEALRSYNVEERRRTGA